MKTLQKLTAVLLALLMLVGCLSLAACGSEEKPAEEKQEQGDTGKTDPTPDTPDEPDEPDTPDEPVEPDEPDEPVEPEKKYLDDLDEQMDYGGETILIFVSEDHNEHTYVTKDPETMNEGDAVESAVYTRQTVLESRMNVSLSLSSINADAYASKAIEMIASGGNDVDVLIGDGKGHAGIAQQGYMLNLNRLPNIDLTKDYWNESYSSKFEYKNVRYWGTGDGLLSLLVLTCPMYVNDELWAKYNSDVDLFQIVKDGQWTAEKFIECTGKVYEDKTGDGRTEDDVYGLRIESDWRLGALCRSAGYKLSTESGSKWVIELAGEENLKAYDALVAMTTGNDGAYQTATAGFGDGQTMCNVYTFEQADWLRSNEMEYSIVPCPKQTEEGDYISYTFEGFPIMGAPSTLSTERYDMIGTFMELYSSLGRQYVTEGYYEIALRSKYARNEGSYDCIELVRKGIGTDMAFAWCGALNQIDTWITNALAGGANLTTAAATSQDAYQKNLNTLYSNLKKLADAEKAAGY